LLIVGDATLSDGNLDVTVLEHSVKLQRLQLEVLLFRQVQPRLELRSRLVDCWLPPEVPTTDTVWVVTAGDVTLSDGDLDVSGTGTFGEAVTTTSEVLLFRQVQPRSVLRSRLVDCWITAGGATITDTGLVVTVGTLRSMVT
jgi:hypothetical protein